MQKEKDVVYSIDYDEQNQCLLVTVKGEFSLSILQKLAGDIVKAAQEKKCRKVLNNLTEAKIAGSALEVYKMPQHAQKIGVKSGFKRALVVGDREEEFYFLETVFKNQGHLVKMFADFEDAKSWLLTNG